MIVRQGDVTGPSSAKRNTILQLALTRSDQCPTQGPLARGLARSVLRRSAGFLAESINRSARWMSRRCSGRSLAAAGRRGRGSATATRTADACCGSPCDDDRVIHECRRDGNAAGGFAPKAFLSEFVGGLHPQQEPRAGLARGFHPQGEDGRDGSLLLDYGGQVRALDAELLGGIRNAEGPALAGGGDVVAWVRGCGTVLQRVARAARRGAGIAPSTAYRDMWTPLVLSCGGSRPLLHHWRYRLGGGRPCARHPRIRWQGHPCGCR